MNKDIQERKEFLEQQLQWIKQQDHILIEIEEKLKEMKRIAEYSLENKLSSSETEQLNEKLLELQNDILKLQKELHADFH